MREDRPSFTAAFVAACRTLGGLLPKESHIAVDPFGARFFGNAMVTRAARSPMVAPLVRVGPLAKMVAYMQVRTRAIDDILLDFVTGGGRQVVLLGAGYDCRAHRFVEALRGVSFFEVDHPRTQAHKKKMLGSDGCESDTRYLQWNFETEAMSALPAALAKLGLDLSKPTLTIWEGVTMYLTENAIDDAVAAVRHYSASGSQFVVTYFERERMIERPSLATRAVRFAVHQVGEPMIFGWRLDEIESWFEQRGFRMLSDRPEGELARAYFNPSIARRVREEGRRIALFARE